MVSDKSEVSPATYVQVSCLRGTLAGRLAAYIDPAPLPLPQPLLLGRGEDCHLCFKGPANMMVSRHHAELQLTAQGIMFRDGSSQGSYLAQTQERISLLELARGEKADIQLGPSGPLCEIASGIAIPFGSYSLVAKLGEGGMAEVYLAGDNRLERFVVLKLLHPAFCQQDPLAGKHLLNEARIVAQLEHHHVVRIYELGELSGIPYIAMEYLRGISLRQLNEQLAALGQTLPPALAAAIVRQACLGLHAAHELPARVVHRDISHNNILITREGVKVIDFGIARTSNASAALATEPNVTKGCPPYMSPEQIRAPQTVTRLSDIFSMAVVLYELCSGQRLFARDHPLATLAAVLAETPLPLRSVCEQASEQLERVLERALAKEPCERQPATAAEFAALLKEEAGPHFLHHENVIGALEQLGVRLHSSPPATLDREPELIRRTRPAAPAPKSDERPLVRARTEAGPTLMQPPRWSNPVDSVKDPMERALVRLDGDWIGIDIPSEMSVGRDYVVRVGAMRGLLQRHLASEAQARAKDDLCTMPLSRLLRLELLPADPMLMTARPLSPAEQPVLRSELTQWDWLVTPHQPGVEQGLQIVATNRVEVRGEWLSKRHPIRVLSIQVRASDGAQSIVGLPTPILRGLLDRLLATAADVDSFCRAGFPEIHRRFERRMDRSTRISLMLCLGDGTRLIDRLRQRDPTMVAQAEAQVRVTMDHYLDLASVDPLLPVVLPREGGNFELHTAGLSRLCVTSQDLNPREYREPIPLALELDGLVSCCRHPLVLALSNRLIELRVAPETVKEGRAFRIYPSELSTNGARNSYALPLPCPGKPLHVGHHRGEHRLLTVASCSLEKQEASPLELDLDELGVKLLAPSSTDRLFAVYRIEPKHSAGYLSCFTVRQQ